jgi:hypothetical protein
MNAPQHPAATLCWSTADIPPVWLLGPRDMMPQTQGDSEQASASKRGHFDIDIDTKDL